MEDPRKSKKANALWIHIDNYKEQGVESREKAIKDKEIT